LRLTPEAFAGDDVFFMPTALLLSILEVAIIASLKKSGWSL
jgi:hypothetical protein